MTFVVAGTFRQFCDHLVTLPPGTTLKEYRYVHRAEDLLFRRPGDAIVRTGTWYARADLAEILDSITVNDDLG